jgi:hypothetical protein
MDNVGLTVVQGISSGSSPFSTASKRNVGLLIESQRGVPSSISRITSLSEFVKRYGSAFTRNNQTVPSYYAVKSIYENAAEFGATLLVGRILDEVNSRASSAVITSGLTANQALQLTTITAGVPGVTASVIRATPVNPQIGDVFELVIGSTSVSFTCTVATVANVTAGLLSALTTLQGNGNTDALSVTGVNNTTNLELTGVITGPSTVTAITSLNPSRFVLSSVSGIVDGTPIYVTTPSPGSGLTPVQSTYYAKRTGMPSNTIEIYTDPNLLYPTSILNQSPIPTIAVSWGGTFNLTSSVFPAGVTSIMRVSAGQNGLKDPGVWGNNLSVRIIPPGNPNGNPNNFVLEVYYNSVLQETYIEATYAALMTEINTNSAYIMVEQLDFTPSLIGIQTVTLSNGAYTVPTEAMYYPTPDPNTPKGLALFDGQDVQLIAIPDITTSTMALKLRDYCAGHSEAVGVASLPYNATSATVQTFSALLQSASVTSRYITCLLNWAKILDDSGAEIWTPYTGVWIGSAFIRCPGVQRDRAFIPPGGTDATALGVLDITHKNITQATINQYVRSYTINVIVSIPGVGIFPISSRTMCTNPLFHSTHISLYTNYILKTLRLNNLYLVQRIISPEYRRDAIIPIQSFFRGEYEDGGLERTVPFDKACKVISDLSNNPRSQDRKLNRITIEWIPAECSESVLIELNRNDGSLLINVLNQ